MSNTAEAFRVKQVGYLPDQLKFDWIDVRRGFARGRFDVTKQHLAPNGYLHAATVVALADTACGYGCMTSLPDGVSGFATIELKANFVGTALEGGVACEARLLHDGRVTQVWDAEVKSETSGKTIALFRCTQMLLSAARGHQ